MTDYDAARADPQHTVHLRDERGFCYDCGTRADGTQLISAAELEATAGYYRNVFSIEVLSDQPLAALLDLAELGYMITEGECSGQVEQVVTNERVSEAVMAVLLKAQGSSPDFLIPANEGGT